MATIFDTKGPIGWEERAGVITERLFPGVTYKSTMFPTEDAGRFTVRQIASELERLGVEKDRIIIQGDIEVEVKLENGTYTFHKWNGSTTATIIYFGEKGFYLIFPSAYLAARMVIGADKARPGVEDQIDGQILQMKSSAKAQEIQHMAATLAVEGLLSEGGFPLHRIKRSKDGIRVEVLLSPKKFVRFSLPYDQMCSRTDSIVPSLKMIRKAEDEFGGRFLVCGRKSPMEAAPSSGSGDKVGTEG